MYSERSPSQQSIQQTIHSGLLREYDWRQDDIIQQPTSPGTQEVSCREHQEWRGNDMGWIIARLGLYKFDCWEITLCGKFDSLIL